MRPSYSKHGIVSYSKRSRELSDRVVENVLQHRPSFQHAFLPRLEDLRGHPERRVLIPFVSGLRASARRLLYLLRSRIRLSARRNVPECLPLLIGVRDSAPVLPRCLRFCIRLTGGLRKPLVEAVSLHHVLRDIQHPVFLAAQRHDVSQEIVSRECLLTTQDNELAACSCESYVDTTPVFEQVAHHPVLVAANARHDDDLLVATLELVGCVELDARRDRPGGWRSKLRALCLRVRRGQRATEESELTAVERYDTNFGG